MNPLRDSALTWAQHLFATGGARRPVVTRDAGLARVRAFEQRHGVRLPAAYVDSVLEWGGRAPSSELFIFATQPTVRRNVLNHLLELDSRWHPHENIDAVLDTWRASDWRPQGLVPFAATPDGAWLCFDFRAQPNAPSIVYLAHDDGPERVYDVAPSFERLLSSLHSAPPSIPLEALERWLTHRPADVVPVDLRDAEAFARGHLPSAINVPLDTLDRARSTALTSRHDVLHVLYDQTGKSAEALAARLFRESPSATSLATLEGGFLEYQLAHTQTPQARPRATTDTTPSLESRSRAARPGSPEAQALIEESLALASSATGDALVVALECLVRLDASAQAATLDADALATRGPREVVRELLRRLKR